MNNPVTRPLDFKLFTIKCSKFHCIFVHKNCRKIKSDKPNVGELKKVHYFIKLNTRIIK